MAFHIGRFICASVAAWIVVPTVLFGQSLSFVSTINIDEVAISRAAEFDCSVMGNKHLFRGDSVFIFRSQLCTYEGQEAKLLQVFCGADTGRCVIPAKWVENGGAIYDSMSKIHGGRLDTIEAIASLNGALLRSNQFSKTLKDIKRVETSGFRVRSFSIFTEQIKGTGLSVSLFNGTTKTVKYVWLTACGLNPVNDPVAGRDGKVLQTVQCIGPIRPKSNGDYSFSYVWRTDIVTDVKLKAVKVQFMDNTFLTLPNIEKAMLSDNEERLLNYFNN